MAGPPTPAGTLCDKNKRNQQNAPRRASRSALAANISSSSSLLLARSSAICWSRNCAASLRNWDTSSDTIGCPGRWFSREGGKEAGGVFLSPRLLCQWGVEGWRTRNWPRNSQAGQRINEWAELDTISHDSLKRGSRDAVQSLFFCPVGRCKYFDQAWVASWSLSSFDWALGQQRWAVDNTIGVIAQRPTKPVGTQTWC